MDHSQTSANETTENVVAGIVGAFLFSLVGGIVWFLLYQINILAGISGLLGVILAIKGYTLFAKKESVRGVIIASVIALLVLILAWYLCIGFELYQAFRDWHEAGEIDYELTFFEAVRVTPLFLTENGLWGDFIKDLFIGLALAIVASVSSVISLSRQVKNRQAVADRAAVEQQGAVYTPADGTERLPDTPWIRSSETDQKVKEFVSGQAFGHTIVYRRVGKMTEELVIDGLVYAECECKPNAFYIKPHELQAFIGGHLYQVGSYNGNYLKVDGAMIASSARMN